MLYLRRLGRESARNESMARPKKWASEAERLAAKVAAQMARREAKTSSVKPKREAETTGHAADAEQPADAPTVADSLQSGQNPDTGNRPEFVSFVDQAHVPRDPMAPPWSGSGRGMPREHKGQLFVLVARGSTDPVRPEHGVVTLADWHARLGQRCQHNLAGWSCHAC